MRDSEWGRSPAAVLSAAAERRAAGDPAVLATVVDVEGRAYRRPGAKMLVDPDGEAVGHVTAGCLEPAVVDVVGDVLAAGAPRLETYDLAGEDDVWGMGVGCDGVVDLLLEPLGLGVDPLLAADDAGEPVVVATVLAGEGLDLGDRFLLHPDGSAEPGTVDPPAALVEALGDTPATLASEAASTTVDVDGTRLFLDAVVPRPTLLVCGAGHDAGPVVELAAANGFATTVVGFRGAVDLADRFPAADATHTTSPADLAADVDVDGDTYAVVMTHSFVDDRLALESLLDTPAPYVGVMGPRDRFAELREAMAEDGRPLDDDDRDRVYAPVGLDLGPGDPYGVATSVVAEVLAVRAGRDPGHLRDRGGTIHDRVDPG